MNIFAVERNYYDKKRAPSQVPYASPSNNFSAHMDDMKRAINSLHKHVLKAFALYVLIAHIVLTIISVCRGLPCGPVCSYGSWSQPLPVHQGDGVLGLYLLGEAHEAVAFGFERLGITNHAAITEIMQFILNFIHIVVKVSNKTRWNWKTKFWCRRKWRDFQALSLSFPFPFIRDFDWKVIADRFEFQ